MAYDAKFWYVAVRAVDDHVVSVPQGHPHPWSGDSLELFLAGSDSTSTADFALHIEAPRSPDQSAFLQIVLPATEFEDQSLLLAAYRTDRTLGERLIARGFSFHVWRGRDAWYGEGRIPLEAFEVGVRSRLRGGGVPFNFDYLDYDRTLAPQVASFFSPDNVFSLYECKCRVYVPKYMRTVVFR